MRHEEDLSRRQLRPTAQEAERDREVVRGMLAEAGWPTDLVDPKETIVIRGPYGWISGPC